jgi:hypothetical protein
VGGGAALVERSRHSSASGGTGGGGSAVVERSREAIGSGSVVSGGAAAIERARVAIGSGGANAGGQAGLNHTPRAMPSSSGGLAVHWPQPDGPMLISLDPWSVTAKGAEFQLRARGRNFSKESVVYFNGAPRPTTFVSSEQLTASISRADIAKPGSRYVTVVTPGEDTSNALRLRVLFDRKAVARENEKLLLLLEG